MYVRVPEENYWYYITWTKRNWNNRKKNRKNRRNVETETGGQEGTDFEPGYYETVRFLLLYYFLILF